MVHTGFPLPFARLKMHGVYWHYPIYAISLLVR